MSNDELAQPVVVGVDGSECSIGALRWAAEQARLQHAPLVALHAWQIPSVGLPGLAPPYPDDEFQTHAEQVLDHVMAKAGDIDVPVERRIVKAHAAQALIDVSKDAALVVVGSHGHGGVAGTLLGSVSQRVASHAHCPVVIVREPGS